MVDPSPIGLAQFSVTSVSSVAYAIAVRSSEYDLPPELLDDIVERTVSAAGSGRRGDERDGRQGRGGSED